LIGQSDILKDEVGQSGYVIGLKYANAPEVAEMLADFSKSVKIDQGGNRLIVYASPRVINEIERIVKSIDHPHIQILLETRVVEVSLDDENQYGIDWGAMSPIETGIAYPQGQLSEGFKAKGWIRDMVYLNLTIDMLIRNGDARLLMNSKLTTTNNREASLHIGEKIPFVIQSYASGGNVSGTSQREVKHELVGVKLSMLPHINEDEEITITLEPEVSSIAGYKGPAGDIPLVKIRKTKTTVRVKDGEIIFLAGLISEEENEEIRKVPILGQIPLLGVLFSHKSKTKRKTNLIIEIRPKIIHSSADLPSPRERTEPKQPRKLKKFKKSKESEKE
jgi:type II secretory pathway component GspD/PulD (secretin)